MRFLSGKKVVWRKQFRLRTIAFSGEWLCKLLYFVVWYWQLKNKPGIFLEHKRWHDVWVAVKRGKIFYGNGLSFS